MPNSLKKQVHNTYYISCWMQWKQAHKDLMISDLIGVKSQIIKEKRILTAENETWFGSLKRRAV